MAIGPGLLDGEFGGSPDMWRYLNDPEENIRKAMMAQAQALGQAQNLQAVINGVQGIANEAPRIPLQTQVRQRQVTRAKELFVNRMKGVRGNFNLKETDFVETHIHADIVILFYCFDGREGIVKEPMDIWPSDGLIAQFRMMLP